MSFRIFGEIFSALAAVFLWISISRPDQRLILKWQNGECYFRITANVLFGGWSGAAIYFTSLVRNCILLYGGEKINKYSIPIILVLQGGLGILTFGHWYDIISIAAGMEYTIFLKNKDALFTKKNLLLNLILWDLYAIFLGGIVMIVTNSIMVITSIIDLYRFQKGVDT